MGADKTGLKEKAVHGTVSFPAAVYHSDGEVFYMVKYHWHEEAELIYLEKGSFQVGIQMKEYTVQAPAILFIMPGELHAIGLSEGGLEKAVVFDMGMLSFERYDAVQFQIIRPLLEGRIQFPQFLYPDSGAFAPVRELFVKMYGDAQGKGCASHMRVKAALYELLAALHDHQLLQHASEPGRNDAYKIENVKKALTFLRENYCNRILVEDVAAIMGMNPQYFCRYFKKLMGRTLTEYVNDIRIDKAAEALLETDRKVLDIAMACGYDNIGYFIKRFRENKGMSPSEYRKTQT